MKKPLNHKLNEKAAKLLAKDLTEQDLTAVTGGGVVVIGDGGDDCPTCGLTATTGT